MHSTTIAKLLVPLMLLAASTNAHAYIDPGTGSLLIQGAIAAVATIVTTVSLYYHKIMVFFGKGKTTGVAAEEESSESSK